MATLVEFKEKSILKSSDLNSNFRTLDNIANDLLKQSLTDNLIAKEFINKWDGKLPTSYAGKDILSIFNVK